MSSNSGASWWANEMSHLKVNITLGWEYSPWHWHLQINYHWRWNLKQFSANDDSHNGNRCTLLQIFQNTLSQMSPLEATRTQMLSNRLTGWQIKLPRHPIRLVSSLWMANDSRLFSGTPANVANICLHKLHCRQPYQLCLHWLQLWLWPLSIYFTRTALRHRRAAVWVAARLTAGRYQNVNRCTSSCLCDLSAAHNIYMSSVKPTWFTESIQAAHRHEPALAFAGHIISHVTAPIMFWLCGGRPAFAIGATHSAAIECNKAMWSNVKHVPVHSGMVNYVNDGRRRQWLSLHPFSLATW